MKTQERHSPKHRSRGWRIGLCGWLLCISCFAAEPPQKPNVIVIVSDDAGYADFSMQGSKNFPTPRIDSIAANGVRFTSGYVTGPVCSPSRAGLMTGRYQTRFGHELNLPEGNSATAGLPLTERTFADAMKAAGYRTIALGKWHLGYAPKFHPLSRGFDDFYGFLAGNRRYFPGATGHKQFQRDRQPVKENFQYVTDELGHQAAAYVRQNKDRPFFMYLAFNAVHTPQMALSSDMKKAHASRKKLAAMTIALDRAVGYVLDELKQQGLAENTLVVFVNDNGGSKVGGKQETGNNSPLCGYKGSTWEGGLRVPFVAQWPAKIPQGKVYHHPVITLDIMSTALAAAGSDADAKLDGVNLLPYLTGENKGAPHAALFWRFGDQRAVRMGDWKLTDTGGPTRLFNLATDIGEKHNLSKQQPAKLKELEAAYAKWNAGNTRAKWGGR
jgi:arylsulfatase A-like enzyme